MFRLNPNELKKQLKKLGLTNVEVKMLEAEEIVIRLADGRELVAAAPQVMLMQVPGGAAMLQVVAESLEERQPDRSSGGEAQVSEEDVRFVAEQAGVSLEEAREALREAGGDIAAALMLLEERKRAS